MKCAVREPVLDLLADIRYAVRALRRHPGFTATAISVLSLGIAASTAIFSVVNKVLLEPLPYPDPDRMVQLVTKSQLGDQFVVSIPKYVTWRDHAIAFQDMAAYDTTGPSVNLTDNEWPQTLEAGRVSADYFRLFGASVQLGRFFSEAEDTPGGLPVVVISNQLWRARFGASPALAGSMISLDDRPYKVVGILAPGFEADRPIDVWLPLRADVRVADHINRVRVAARLRPGLTFRDGVVSLAETKRWFVRRYPQAPLMFQEGFTAVSLRDALVGNVRPALLLLSGAVAFVLLIACANVGSLVLARGVRRGSEIATRAALGAGRGRLVRQLLTESMLLALAAGALGLVLGFAGLNGLLALSPAELPRVGANGSAIALDWRVFLFTLLVSTCTGILFGLAPALTASRANVMILVNNTQAQSGMSFRRGGSRSFLVVSEIALALVLLVGAGLLIRTFVAARTADPGFDGNNVLTGQMSLQGPQFERPDRVADLVRKVEQRMEKTRGVFRVATTSALPLSPSLTLPFTITRHDQTLVGRYHGVAEWRSVSPGFFDAFRIRLLGGRLFTKEDNEHAAGVVLINRLMMRKFWPEVRSNPIGEFLIIGKGLGAGLEDVPRQVIGVVADIREAGLERDPMLYVPVSQVPDGLNRRNNRVLPVTWVIRTEGRSVSLPEIAMELTKASGGLPLGQVRTMHEVVAVTEARAQFYVLLLSVFAVVALLLAAFGLYGVMSYSVQQRRREIGLRMALGAEAAKIQRMVVWQGLRLTLIGIGVGIPAAVAFTRVMGSLIFGIPGWSPGVFVGVSLLLACAALTAAYLPSVRATEVNPCEALRS